MCLCYNMTAFDQVESETVLRQVLKEKRSCCTDHLPDPIPTAGPGSCGTLGPPGERAPINASLTACGTRWTACPPTGRCKAPRDGVEGTVILRRTCGPTRTARSSAPSFRVSSPRTESSVSAITEVLASDRHRAVHPAINFIRNFLLAFVRSVDCIE